LHRAQEAGEKEEEGGEGESSATLPHAKAELAEKVDEVS
jgi:hypothetical protein